MKKKTHNKIVEVLINIGACYTLLLSYFIFYKGLYKVNFILTIGLILFYFGFLIYTTNKLSKINKDLVFSYYIAIIVGFLFSIIGIILEKLTFG